MKIFEFNDYRAFLVARIQAMPRRGRGELQKIAQSLAIHTTSLSQVLNGQREFTPEQAQALAVYLGLSDLETDYLVTLVQRERAGTDSLRKTIDRQLESIREESTQMARRLPRDMVLSEEVKAIFYSNWYFSAIRLLCSFPEYGTIDSVADYFGLSKNLVREVLDFLIATGLCVESDGKVKMGPKRTHLEAKSLLISRHHTNWRLKAMERFDRIDSKNELVFSAPMSISKSDVPKVRELLAQTAEKIVAFASNSGSEELYCFNLDWVSFGKQEA